MSTVRKNIGNVREFENNEIQGHINNESNYPTNKLKALCPDMILKYLEFLSVNVPKF